MNLPLPTEYRVYFRADFGQHGKYELFQNELSEPLITAEDVWSHIAEHADPAYLTWRVVRTDSDAPPREVTDDFLPEEQPCESCQCRRCICDDAYDNYVSDQLHHAAE